MGRPMLNFAAVSQYFPDHTLEDVVELCVQTGKAEAWEAFLHRTKAVVGATVATTMRRWKACKTVPVEDIIQEVYLKLSKNNAALLRGFRSNYPNAIFGYLRATASSVASDHCKALSASRRGVQQQQQFGEQEPVAEISLSPSIEHEVLIRELDRALRVVASGPTKRRDIVIFWLYYRQGFTASGIAAIPWIGLTAKGVESTILRLTRLVRAAVGETPSDSAKLNAQGTKVVHSKSSL
jgi:RNA polymerase sigma-70 factor, ECF subfamily